MAEETPAKDDGSEKIRADSIKSFLDLAMISLDLSKQTDRGFAILSVAFLDELLKEAILSRLSTQDEIAADLFEIDGPLSSFDAKSRLAYSLGIIGKGVLGDLYYIRKIRNKFAHISLVGDPAGGSLPMYFGVQQISDWCGNLKLPKVFSDIGEHYETLMPFAQDSILASHLIEKGKAPRRLFGITFYGLARIFRACVGGTSLADY